MDDARALLDVETPPETGSVTASAVKRRAMWGMLWSGVLSAIVVLVLFMPKTEHGGSKDLVQLAQWSSDFDALDVEAERADFGRLASKASELADLLRVLRGSVMRSPALPKEFFADTREKILELLQTLQGKVSPLDAVKLGISVTTKDLARLGVPLEDSTAPSETNAETNIIRTSVEPDGDSHGGHGGHGQKMTRMADVPGSFGAGPPWTDGLVRFCFHANVPSRIKTLVQNAMLELEKAIPCIRFKQIKNHRTSSTNCEVYPSVIITSFDNRGCASSHLGWYSRTTQQWVNLKARKPRQGHCEVLGIAIHELGHLLGMAHEQARPDASKYVTIHWDNINPNYTRQFKVNDKADNERPYDLLSVMHYGSEAFSINDKDTITPKSSGCWHYTSDASLCERIKDNMGQRNGITQLDADQLGDLYKSQNKLCRSSLAQSNPASDGLPLQRWVPRTPLSYNTMGVAYAYPFPCKAASQTRVWSSAGGGALLWRHGNLAFYQGDDKGETIWSHVVWQSGTCADCGGGFEPRSNPGAHLCFHSNGNLVIYSQTRRLLWATGTYPGRRAPWGAWRMAIFDHHWAMMSPRIKPREGVQKEVLPYSMVRYPSEAPSSIEILPWLIGWFGCLTDVTWETLGGAQLRFHDGELVFYPGDGHGNKDDPIWRSGTKHIGKELCFAEDGNLLINSATDWVWRSGTFDSSGGRSPEGATSLVVFDGEWSMFSATGVALVTFPPSTKYFKVDHFSSTLST